MNNKTNEDNSKIEFKPQEIETRWQQRWENDRPSHLHFGLLISPILI